MAAEKTSAGNSGDRLVQTISHSLRIEILQLLGERPASPRELAAETGAGLGDVSYHVKYLLRQGLIEASGAEPRRSSIEHYYRLKPVAPAEQAIRGLVGEVVRALNAGAFVAGDRGHLEWTAIGLDERGRRELLELQARWSEELERLRAAAEARLADGEAPGGVQTIVAALSFEAAPGLSRGWGASDAGA